MASAIAYQKPRSGRLVALFLLSIGVHVAVAMFAIWASHHLKYTPKEEEMLDLGIDVTLGEEVQELIAAQTPPTPEPPPPEPPTPPPEPPPEPEPEPEPPMEKPEFVEPKPEPKATPAPKPVVAKPAPAPPGAKTGPTPRPGVVGGNVTQGKLTGTPGGTKLSTTGIRKPRPSYPPAARAARIQGRGAMRVSYGPTGSVTSVVITQPINPLLDANTRTFVRANWKGAPNTTETCPVHYVLQ